MLVIQVACTSCDETMAYKVTGLRVVAFSNGMRDLEFFCLACKAFMRRPVTCELAIELVKAAVPWVPHQVAAEFLDADIRNGKGPRGYYTGCLDDDYLKWYLESLADDEYFANKFELLRLWSIAEQQVIADSERSHP